MGKWRQGAIRSLVQDLIGWDLSGSSSSSCIPNAVLNCLELFASKVRTEMDLEMWKRGRGHLILVDSREKEGKEEVETVWRGVVLLSFHKCRWQGFLLLMAE